MTSTNFRSDSFPHVLIADVAHAHERLKHLDSPTHRRELIRAAFAGMEGIHWQLKQTVLNHADKFSSLSTHERAALLEETYSVDDRGAVRSQPRFLTLPVAIRLVVNVVQRYSPNYKVDFSQRGWAALRIAIDVRNRLVHPKDLDDLNVSDSEIEAALAAFYWVLALAIEGMAKTVAHLEDLNEKASPLQNPTL